MARTFINIDNIVNDYMINRDEDDYGKITSPLRVRSLALAALRDLQYDSLRTFKAMSIPVNKSTMSIDFPTDYVTYSKIGVLNDNNQFVTLVLNNNLPNLNQENLLDGNGGKLLDSDNFEITAYSDNNNKKTRIDIGKVASQSGKNLIFSSNISNLGLAIGDELFNSDGEFSLGSIVSFVDSFTVELTSNTASSVGDYIYTFKYGSQSSSSNNLIYPPSDVNYNRSYSRNGIFGASGGKSWAGSYREDIENGRIFFSSDFPQDIDNVIIEYLADETMSSNPRISVYAEEAVKNYIYWKHIQRKSNVGLGEKQIAKKNYTNEKAKTISRLFSPTKAEILSQFWNANSAATPRTGGRYYY